MLSGFSCQTSWRHKLKPNTYSISWGAVLFIHTRKYARALHRERKLISRLGAMHILSLFASFSYPFWYLYFKAFLSVIYFSKSRSKIQEQIKIMLEIYLAYKQTATCAAHRPSGGRRRRELGRPPWLSSACCTSPCRARGGAPRRWRGELGQPPWPSTRRARARGEATPPMLPRV
jgi:hypothetical protein